MTPTMKLRYIRRIVGSAVPNPELIGNQIPYPVYGNVLQQWWEDKEIKSMSEIRYIGQWIDVPVEVENYEPTNT